MKVRAKPEVHDHVLDEYAHQSLSPDRIYEVIGLDDEYYRIVDDAGEPILYPKYLFTMIDPYIPESWIRKEYGPDEYYIDPPELCARGFYDAYFDGKPEAMAIFKRFLISYGLFADQ